MREGEPPGRCEFEDYVLFEVLGLTSNDVWCVQGNRHLKYIDVSLRNEEIYKRASVRVTDKKKENFLRDYEVLGCYNYNFRVMIVHLYDPFLGDDDVTAFLLRHVSVMGQPEKILDSRNIWTGKRKYRVLLRSDARGAGGGHVARECRKKVCTLCGVEGHLFKGCKWRNIQMAWEYDQGILRVYGEEEEASEEEEEGARPEVGVAPVNEGAQEVELKQGTAQLVRIWTTKTPQCRKWQKTSRNLGK
ncbi:ZCHC3 protein, partial [Atractosteus spatula]|nr:ZCHC3 protein [Atractosteus spatula]